MSWTIYKDLYLDTLKSKALVGTDANGKLIENTTGYLPIGSFPIYLGVSTVDGTWRINVVGTDLTFERRESGNYVIKGSIQS
jgi:hypothetical protein